jgi:hypothetical protein
VPPREPTVRISAEPRLVAKPTVREAVSRQFLQPSPPPPVPLNASVVPAPDLPSSGQQKRPYAFLFAQFRRRRLNHLSPCRRLPHRILRIAVAPVKEDSKAPL